MFLADTTFPIILALKVFWFLYMPCCNRLMYKMLLIRNLYVLHTNETINIFYVHFFSKYMHRFPTQYNEGNYDGKVTYCQILRKFSPNEVNGTKLKNKTNIQKKPHTQNTQKTLMPRKKWEQVETIRKSFHIPRTTHTLCYIVQLFILPYFHLYSILNVIFSIY
jgi:hypothetical protein